MKSIFYTGLTAIAILLSSMVLNAQSEQWTWSQQLLGNWKGPVTAVLGGQEFLVNYKMHFKSAVDGNAMTMDEGFSHPDLGTLKGTNLIGVSASDGMIHWFSVDNFGTAHDHVGSWSDSKHFQMMHESTIEGLAFVEVATFTLNENNSKLTATLTATVGGEVVQTLEGVLSKNNSNPDQNPVAPFLSPKNESAFLVDVYPNPSTGEITIDCSVPIEELVILNEKGQIIRQSFPNASSHSVQLSENGTYVVRVKQNGQYVAKKVNVFKH